MKRSDHLISDELFDLMCKRETVGLDPAEEREYSRLVDDHPTLSADGLGHTAAILHGGLASAASDEPMPESAPEPAELRCATSSWPGERLPCRR